MPGLLALLAVAAWIARDHMALPEPVVSGSKTPLGQQVYYGPPRSIAVLPFSSSEPDQQPLAEGFARELIDMLQQLPDLQTTAPTSSFFFRDRDLPARIAAEQLQAAYILTGEYREEDGFATISLRLLDARRDVEALVKTFSGSPLGPDSVHAEVLSEVLGAMGIGASAQLQAPGLVDPAARSLYLRGLYYLDPGGGADPTAARRAFEQALEIAPAYGPTWFGLAAAWLATGDPQGQARAALGRALEVDPDDADALGLLAFLLRSRDWDWQAAAQAASRALELKPGDASLMGIAALSLSPLGRFERAVELLEGAVRSDPVNLAMRAQLGIAQEFAGQYEESLSSHRQVAGLNEQFPGVYAYRARVKLIQEKPESALKESDKENDAFWGRYARILALTALQRNEEAADLLAAMIAENAHDAAFQLAEIHAFGGQVDAAFDWLDRAYHQRDGGLSETLGNHFLRNLHDDSRWQRLLERLRLPVRGAASRAADQIEPTRA